LDDRIRLPLSIRQTNTGLRQVERVWKRIREEAALALARGHAQSAREWIRYDARWVLKWWLPALRETKPREVLKKKDWMRESDESLN
jgi:hypothetical protein